jgi:RNA polymerase sigma-70 factor (ECF subfamily)
MGDWGTAALDASSAPVVALREYFGFVPSVFRRQSLLPRLIAAETDLAAPILFQRRALSQKQKELLLLTLAAANRNTYCATAHYQMLCLLGEPEERLEQLLANFQQVDLSRAELALLDFAVRLGTNGPSISRTDVSEISALGWTSETILETVLITAWGNFLCSLSIGLGASPDFTPVTLPSISPFVPPARLASPSAPAGPYLEAPELDPGNFPPFAFFHEQFGFIPNVFRALSLRPDVIEALAVGVRVMLLAEDHLTRLQKERILLEVSAANRNTYFVAVHSEIAGALGMSPEPRSAGLPEADTLLLDCAHKLASEASGLSAQDLAQLRGKGFTDAQILEAIVFTSFTCFLNTIQFGVGAKADFEPQRVFPAVSPKLENLLAPNDRSIDRRISADPDAGVVAKAQGGDLGAFEDLINRHSRRIYRTLVGILGSSEEARDAMQDTFLKAFEHLSGFQGRSKFSTWLVSIACNTGLQSLRDRKGEQHLDDYAVEPDEGFRPRQVRAWTDNPEQMYSKAEVRALVEDNVMKLPVKYRVVLMLRDIEQLSIEEAAAALGVGIPALKSRHLRGRMMLREALTPHFTSVAKGGTV